MKAKNVILTHFSQRYQKIPVMGNVKLPQQVMFEDETPTAEAVSGSVDDTMDTYMLSEQATDDSTFKASLEASPGSSEPKYSQVPGNQPTEMTDSNQTTPELNGSRHGSQTIYIEGNTIAPPSRRDFRRPSS